MFMAANGIPGSFGSFYPEQCRHKCANRWPLMAFYRQLDLGATNAIDSIGGLDLCFLGRPILEPEPYAQTALRLARTRKTNNGSKEEVEAASK